MTAPSSLRSVEAEQSTAVLRSLSAELRIVLTLVDVNLGNGEQTMHSDACSLPGTSF